MQKHILYIGYNFSPELTGIGKYSGEMMEWLAAAGHHCTVVTAYPYYPQWEVQEPYKHKSFWYSKEEKTFTDGGQMTVYRCPMYVPKQPNGKKRIMSDFSFFVSAFLKTAMLCFKKKHGFVISVAPTFLSGVLGALYKKVSGAKHIHHIQDLQIEAASELGMIKSKRLVNSMFKIERFIFKNTDVISSISEAMIRRIAEKSKQKVAFLPNSADTNFFYPLEERNSLKSQFGFDDNDTIILYSGAIGEKQGLENILSTAQTLKEHHKLKFVICGSGPYKEVLKNKAQASRLQNVHFLPLQSKENFNAFLNMADVHLVIQKRNAGNLVMPSKLTTILAVGGAALVTAEPGTDLYNVISKYQMGFLIAPENKKELTKGVLHLSQSNEVSTLQTNALNYARQHLTMDKIMNHLEVDLLI